jgi:hypothetical protein
MPKTGLLASLRGLCRSQGSGAPSSSVARGRGVLLLVLATVLGALPFAAAPALAATPEAPETRPATAETATTATVHGVLDPKAASSELVVEYIFFYAPGGAACTEGSVAPESPGIATGKEAEAVEQDLTGLQPNAQYAVCLAARNPGEEGWAVGNAVHFTTLPAAPEVVAETESAGPVLATEATLNAQVNPNNEKTKYFFEYSTVEAEVLASKGTKVPGASELENFGGQGVSVPTGAVLTPGTTYYYRVVAENKQSEIEVKPVVGTVEHFTTPVHPEVPGIEPVSGVAARTATFSGVLNPHALGSAGSYEFLYKKLASGAGCAGEAASGGVARGATPEAVNAAVSGLEPDTAYTFCLLARNEAGEEAISAPVTFRTLPEASVSDVAASSATFNAVLNPEGGTTTYHFEYGPSSEYGSDTPVETATGPPPVNTELHLQGLSAGTLYHYRVLATNTAHETFESTDQTFTTQTANTGLVLPDGRQWELVSPPDKGGAKIEPIPAEGGVIQAAEGGGAVTYVANFAVGAGVQGNPAPSLTQLLSARDAAGGWSTQDIATVHNSAFGATVGHPTEYLFFSSDLSLGLVQPKGETPLPPLGEGAEKTIYIREPNGSYTPLVTAANVTSGEKFAGPFLEPEFEGASSGLNHVVLRSEVPLTSGPEVEGEGLYEWSAGALRPVSVLPGGTASGDAFLGSEGIDTRNAISEDGSRVFWEGARNLFMRQMTSDETIQLNSVEAGVTGGCGEAGECRIGPVFQAANRSGSEALFTDEARLTSNSTAEFKAPDLYMFEVTGEAPLTGKVTDLTADQGQPANVQGTAIGSGENVATKQITSAYFVAKGVLAENENKEHEKAAAGANNLYVARRVGSGWTTTFIAALAGDDGDDWAAKELGLGEMTARVSPDGEYLAFMSDKSLTGYDNRDAKSGEPDEEVFLYHAATGSLACVSCDPTGARPLGVYDPVSGLQNNFALLTVDNPQNWRGRWLAGSIPGWTQSSHGVAHYQARYLSDSGRLFFNSPDTLVPQATNGLENVFEYEPAGFGSCEGTSSTYSPHAAGCTSLISSGTSADESAFVDASESGDDVFFVTESRLVGQDEDKAYDMYDAHVCSTVAPCPSAPAVVPPACTTADSCRAAASPQPQIFGSPSSETFSGAGNTTPVPLVAPKKVTKKTVKCKRGFVKNEKNRCIRKKTKKAKKSSARRAGRDRRTQS